MAVELLLIWFLLFIQEISLLFVVLGKIYCAGKIYIYRNANIYRSCFIIYTNRHKVDKNQIFEIHAYL